MAGKQKNTNSNSGKGSQNKSQKREPNKKSKPRPKRGQSSNSAPVAVSRSISNNGAKFAAQPNGGTRVRHRELIGNMVSQATFAFQTLGRYRLNPASAGTFNWLPQIAVNYEFYKFHMLKFHYETRSPTSLGGAVVMSPDYDASENAQQAASEQSIFNNKGTKDDAVWKSITLVCDPKSMNRLYKAHSCMVDSRFATTAQDKKTVDVGQVFFCTDVSSAAVLGKLIVEYDVEFFNPQAVTEVVGGGASWQYGSMTPNSTQGILAAAVSSAQESVPLTMVNTNVSYPTATVLQATKDFSGLLSTIFQGTGLSTGPSVYVGTNGSTAAGTGDDVAQSAVGPFSTAVSSTAVSKAFKISMQAGQYLKLITPTGTTISGGLFDLAASSLSALL